MAAKETPDATLQTAEELARRLTDALSIGNEEETVRLSLKLCRRAMPVSVTIGTLAYPQDSINLIVGVEDAQSDSATQLTLQVSCGMTIAQLKNEVKQNFAFPPALQRWVIGKRLARDHETLHSHGIRRDGDRAFLFIRSARPAHLNRRLEGVTEPITPTPPPLPPPPPPRVRTRRPLPGWECPECTFVNQPTRPGCQMCDRERPNDYRVPEGFKPVGDEARRIQREKLATFLFQEAQQAEQEINALDLLQTDKVSVVPSPSEAICHVCLSELEPGEGLELRVCMHTLCRECLPGVIVNLSDDEVSFREQGDMKRVDPDVAAVHEALLMNFGNVGRE
ncbi:ranBP-type and C3HC4-type zinc finger-containing protein 1-like [Festucalex cinctus]